MYRCRKGCFSSDPDFRCEHGGRTGKAVEPVLKSGGDLYLNVYDPTVDHPANAYRRHLQDIRAQSEQRTKRDRAKAERNQKAWAEWVIQVSNDLALCPCLSPPQAY